MKFYIAIEEMRSTVVTVEAQSPEEAIEKARYAYAVDNICLNDPEYIDDGTCFYDETDKWNSAVEHGYVVNFQNIQKI